MTKETMEYITAVILEKAEMEKAYKKIQNDHDNLKYLYSALRKRNDSIEQIKAGELSGYYWIKGNLTHEGMDARVHFHRGKGLPGLSNIEGIKELLFTATALQEMEKDIPPEYVSNPMSNLDDFFTKEEVINIIQDLEPETIDIEIGYVLRNSINAYDSSISNMGYDGSIRTGNYTLYEPSDSDKYIQTIKWL